MARPSPTRRNVARSRNLHRAHQFGEGRYRPSAQGRASCNASSRCLHRYHRGRAGARGEKLALSRLELHEERAVPRRPGGVTVFKFLDAYSLRARLFPAILGAAPALAALALLVSWQHVHMSNIIASITLFVLVFALADFARKLGVAVEPKIYAEMGGKPSVTMFHRSDTTIEEATKDRYRNFIAGKINQAVPSSRQESA